MKAYPHRRTWLLFTAALLSPGDTLGQEQFASAVVVRRAPLIGGTVEGTVQCVVAENVTLAGGAKITGDLVVPGTPTVTVGTSASLGGVIEGVGETHVTFYHGSGGPALGGVYFKPAGG